MNNLGPIDLKDPRIKTRSSSIRTSRKLLMGLLVVLILSAMIAWIGFLGWGAAAILRTTAAYIVNLCTAIF